MAIKEAFYGLSELQSVLSDIELDYAHKKIDFKSSFYTTRGGKTGGADAGRCGENMVKKYWKYVRLYLKDRRL